MFGEFINKFKSTFDISGYQGYQEQEPAAGTEEEEAEDGPHKVK